MTTVQGMSRIRKVLETLKLRQCKRTQQLLTLLHVAPNNVGSFWPTMLRPFARGLTYIRIRVGNLSNCPFHARMPETRHWRKKSTSFARKIVVVVSLNVPK